MISDVLAMRLIRREMTIPVPMIYVFDAAFDVELVCPFILMELVDGAELSYG